RLLGGRRLKLVHLVGREQGFILQPGNPKAVKGLADLARPGMTFINRQVGSGTRVLLDYHLAKSGIDSKEIKGYDQEEYTHMTVAAAVLSGRADAGLGILAAARALKLDFIPLAQESYQLVIPEEYFQTPKIKALLEVIASATFKTTVEGLGGYSVEGCGEVVYEH
ncbi:MAG: molybdopterin biosynthesis protein, partial [Deltaproteobacteria bacterium]|nr:molybdopterin biosynthesis protein [Deltaproteobacteria bacterium]